MLSYIAPPIVATFLLGVFSRRVNAQGAFIGLVSGLVMAIVILIFKQQMFGSMHFLFIIPILFSISSIITWGTSLFFAKPDASKLTDTLFDRQSLQAEWKLSLTGHFWSNSFFWALLLIIMSISVWIIFS
jgi:SSS family solute:Na+ symporter